jgi:hypothetical protein
MKELLKDGIEELEENISYVPTGDDIVGRFSDQECIEVLAAELDHAKDLLNEQLDFLKELKEDCDKEEE